MPPALQHPHADTPASQPKQAQAGAPRCRDPLAAREEKEDDEDRGSVSQLVKETGGAGNSE